MELAFKIRWADCLGPEWMTKDEIVDCIVARHRGVSFSVTDITYAIDLAETEAAAGHLETWPPEPGH